MAESCFATPKSERIDMRPWPTRAAVRLAPFAWLEVRSNCQRRPHAHQEHRVILSRELAA